VLEAPGSPRHEGFRRKAGCTHQKAEEIFTRACLEAGADEEQAAACGEKIATQLTDDTLLFVSDTGAAAFAAYAAEKEFDISKIKDNKN